MKKIGILPFFCLLIIFVVNLLGIYSRDYLQNREINFTDKNSPKLNGRVVITFSRYLHFLARHESEFLNLRKGFPVQTINMLKAYESILSEENFLWFAVEDGTARKVYHIIPEKTLPEKIEVAKEITLYNVKEGEPWNIRGRIIKGHYRHTPRYVLTLRDLSKIKEKVILIFHPSYFEFDEKPEEVYYHLKTRDIQADFISFYIPDGYINDEAKEKLLRLKWMIENMPL